MVSSIHNITTMEGQRAPLSDTETGPCCGLYHPRPSLAHERTPRRLMSVSCKVLLRRLVTCLDLPPLREELINVVIAMPTLLYL